MKNLLPLLLLPLFLACSTETKDASPKQHKELAALFDAIENSGKSSEDSLGLGRHPRGAWQPVTVEFKQTRADSLRYFLDVLEAISDSELTEQERISKAVMRMSLTDRIDDYNFKMFLIPFNAEGGFYNELSYTLPNLPFQTAENYYDYLGWLPNYERTLRENLALMQQGMSEGIVAPKIIVNNTLALLKPWVNSDYKQSAFYAPITQMPETMGESDRQAILEQSEKVISSLTQTYQDVYNFFANDYLSAAKDEPGIGFLPGGKTYYENTILPCPYLPTQSTT